MMSDDLRIIGNRYRLINALGTGAMGTVYRAYDRLNGIVVALKRVHMPSSPASPSDTQTIDDPRLGLANEFKVLAALRHPNIISVIDYGFDADQRPYLTMELVENARDILEVARERDFDGKIDLLLDVLTGLTYLHRHKIVHSDLKPSNILIDPYGRAKILDFGLAMERNITNNMRGTLAYMAPEVMRGDSVTEATDLYAIGVIAYEFFAQKRPFDSSDFAQFIVETVQERVDFLPLLRSNVPESIVAIIERLLEKQPKDRFPDSHSVIEALCEATHHPTPRENTIVRDSFLRSAPFVGRREEMFMLEQALDHAVSADGTAWLLCGESGIGKSRLLEEFRTYALVNGALVLKGKFKENDATETVWHDILRVLALSVDLSDKEANAFRLVLPDIETLLERRIPKEEQAYPLFDLLWRMTRIFHRQKRPIVILLEDLHFGHHSFRLINALCRVISNTPVMLVGTYRVEEDPYFYGKLPYMHRMTLSRLSDEEILELSSAMLGKAGREQRFLEMLKRETEGNLYFIIEVIRTLAHKLDRLGRITTITLPEHIIAQGMIEVAQRRLRRIPFHQLGILRVAAVVGRVIHFPILEYIDQDIDYLEWLQACVNASILEFVDGQWRFTHDKLREAILSQLLPHQREKLHRTVALSIEHLYPNDPTCDQDLLYHWRMVGDKERQTYYLQRLGLHNTNDDEYSGNV